MCCLSGPRLFGIIEIHVVMSLVSITLQGCNLAVPVVSPEHLFVK